uniref:Uncharacterized protein n=1 Tax=Aegilops tauschii subsp. strangulata TaxID=200361 RepID=A0A453N7L3_AEGTS
RQTEFNFVVDLDMATKLTAIAFFLLLLTFGESSNRVEPPSSQENTFDTSAYAVRWDPDHAPSEEKGFGESSYAVHWDPDHSPSKEN